MLLYEFTERELHALHDENTGTPYHRQHVIASRAMDAKFTAAERPAAELCQFRNKHGWCKLPELHEGLHTVIFLGAD